MPAGTVQRTLLVLHALLPACLTAATNPGLSPTLLSPHLNPLAPPFQTPWPEELQSAGPAWLPLQRAAAAQVAAFLPTLALLATSALTTALAVVDAAEPAAKV